MNKIIQLGNAATQRWSTRINSQNYRVYHIKGIAPTINTGATAKNPYIVVKKVGVI